MSEINPPLRIALYGDNGHQLHLGNKIKDYPCELLGYAAFSDQGQKQMADNFPEVAAYANLDELLALPQVELVVLCSPFRKDQAADAIRCLEAGKHVLAEKPCAFNENELDRILQAVETTGCIFHEMAGTVYSQPWWAMRKIIAEGTLGEIHQVLVQKSYPFYVGRPCDEDLDGGLIAQNAVHALRFIELVAGKRILDIQAIDSPIGETRSGSDLRMVSAYMGRLEGGALFSGVANYCNPFGFGSWGNEMLRIWGSKGMIEAVDGGQKTRLVLGDKDLGPLDCSEATPDYFLSVLTEIRNGTPLPFTLEAELHPTRMVLQARKDALQRRN